MDQPFARQVARPPAHPNSRAGAGAGMEARSAAIASAITASIWAASALLVSRVEAHHLGPTDADGGEPLCWTHHREAER